MSLSRFAVACVCAGVFTSSSALAEGYMPPAKDSKAVELAKLGQEKKTSYAMPGSRFRVGRAEVLIAAPLAQVRQVVTDFSNYSAMIPKFQKSKVLGKDDKGANVYMQVPLLGGAATIWSLMRFSHPIKDANGERVVGSMVKGNVDDMRLIARYRAVDATHTLLTVDVFASLSLPVPVSLVTKEAEDAAAAGARAFREHAQQRQLQVASTKSKQQ